MRLRSLAGFSIQITPHDYSLPCSKTSYDAMKKIFLPQAQRRRSRRNGEKTKPFSFNVLFGFSPETSTKKHERQKMVFVGRAERWGWRSVRGRNLCRPRFPHCFVNKFELSKLVKQEPPSKNTRYGVFFDGGWGRIRTFEGRSQQIYSLSCLTASVPTRGFLSVIILRNSFASGKSFGFIDVEPSFLIGQRL